MLKVEDARDATVCIFWMLNKSRQSPQRQREFDAQKLVRVCSISSDGRPLKWQRAAANGAACVWPAGHSLADCLRPINKCDDQSQKAKRRTRPSNADDEERRRAP